MIAVVPTPDAPPDPEELFRALCRTMPRLRGAPVPPLPRRAAEDPDPARPEVQAEERRHHARHDRPRGARHLPAEGMRNESSERDTACIPHLPALRGDVRPRGDDRADGVERIRGDAADVFSQGYICPKGASIGDLHHDPDRLRQPHVRRPDGSHEAVGWDEAFAEVERLLVPILEAHGPDAIGAYVGNPMGHSLAGSLYLRGFHKMLGTRSLYTVGTIDQQPKSLASGLLYGSQFTGRDPRRRSHLASPRPRSQPVVSNGSLIAAPDMRGRLRAIRARGGKVVVVDPCGREPRARRTSTTSSGPGRTRCCSPRWRTPCSTRSSSACGASRRTSPASTEVRGVRRGVPAGARRSGLRDRGDADPPARARARRRRERRGLRPDRDDAAGIRHGGELARRRAERADREPRPARRRHVHDPRCRRADVHRGAGPRLGRLDGALAQPGARPARGARRAAARLPRRGDRHSGRGAAARARDVLRQPGAQQSERAAAARRRSASSSASSASTSISTRRPGRPT